MKIMKIVEIIIVIISVIGLVWCGIFVGREFGTFEKFILALLNKLKEKLGDGQSN